MSLVREMPAIFILSICTAVLLLTSSSFKKGEELDLCLWGSGGGVGGGGWSFSETNKLTGCFQLMQLSCKYLPLLYS